MAPAAVSDLVRPGEVDGAHHQRLFKPAMVSARRLPRELPAGEPDDEVRAGTWSVANRENPYFVYDNQERKQEAKFALSYVTGSHSIKMGFENRWANAIQENPYNSDIAILFTINNFAVSGHRRNGPSLNKMQFNWTAAPTSRISGGWAASRSTLGRGTTSSTRSSRRSRCRIRTSSRASRFHADQQHAELERLGGRMGIAWDVFGTGKTAVKFFAGRFVAGEAFSNTSQFNPIYSLHG